jgi:uncharacterized protein YuzE
MVKVDAIEGTVDGVLWCHYDIENDVLYLRIESQRDAETYAEETDEGLLLRRLDNDEVAGLTVVNWWKRFGTGQLPDSIHAIERAIEPWAKKFAA